MKKFYTETPNGIVLAVKVIPNAGKSEVVSVKEGELSLRIAGLPEDGRANKELIRFLSKTLKISKSRISILSGEKSRHKKLLLEDVFVLDPVQLGRVIIN